MTLHPLPARIRHWPASVREHLEELAGKIAANTGCSREDSEARAEALLRERHARWGDGPVWKVPR